MFTLRLFQLKKHSRRVTLFKRGLPVFAFLLASLILIWPMLFAEQKEQFAMAVSDGRRDLKQAKVDMEAVRFFAMDKKQQPLTVTAPKVLETDPEKQLITLYKPTATYTLDSGVILTAVTSHGVVDQAAELMTFEDEVTATTDTGYRAVSTHVVCHNGEGTLTGSAPITITGPVGRLKAAGFHLSDKGNRILFTGKTDTTVNHPDGNIRIRSDDGLLIEQIPQTITAEKNVRVNQTGRTITADKMILYYLTKEQNPENKIKKIEAFGHVTASADNRTISGDKGVYDPITGEVIMTGHTVLSQGGSHMDGQTARLNLITGESTLVPSDTAETKGRIKGRLIPADFKGENK